MDSSDLPKGLIQTIGANTTTVEAADRLAAAIESSDTFGLVARIEHSAGAERVGLELIPITEILFGNPAGGTPLMQIAPTAGIDLPQKILIIQTETGVRVLHNDPAYIAERHGIPADTPQLAGIGNAVQGLANVAAGI